MLHISCTDHERGFFLVRLFYFFSHISCTPQAQTRYRRSSTSRQRASEHRSSTLPLRLTFYFKVQYLFNVLRDTEMKHLSLALDHVAKERTDEIMTFP